MITSLEKVKQLNSTNNHHFFYVTCINKALLYSSCFSSFNGYSWSVWIPIHVYLYVYLCVLLLI